jgi:hypothetical protein
VRVFDVNIFPKKMTLARESFQNAFTFSAKNSVRNQEALLLNLYFRVRKRFCHSKLKNLDKMKGRNIRH